MKKIVLLIITLLIVCSCYEKDCITTVKYNLYCPNNVIERTYQYETSNNPCYVLASNRGSNYLIVYEDGSWPYHGARKLENTSAPIVVISFITQKK